jgi:hypothetical protein
VVEEIQLEKAVRFGRVNGRSATFHSLEYLCRYIRLPAIEPLGQAGASSALPVIVSQSIATIWSPAS